MSEQKPLSPKHEVKRGEFALYSFAGRRSRAEVEPSFVAAGKDGVAPGARERVSTFDAQQGLYVSASGMLIQFNAIVAAIQGAAITSNIEGTLKIIVSTALALHVIAAFVLCWAARPIDPKPSTVRGMVINDDFEHLRDTLRHYRRGWRLTILALLVTSAAAVVFLLNAFGLAIQSIP